MNDEIHMELCPVFCTDLSLNISYTNKVWDSLFQVSQNLEKILSDRKQLEILKESLTLQASNFPFHLELNLKSVDGDILPYMWTIVYVSNNKFYYYGYNLGQRKEIETRYERMYHSTTDAVMLLSKDKFTDCNQATLNIFKFHSVNEFIKFHPSDLSPPFQPDGEASLTKANRMIEIAFKEGRNFFEWMHRDSKGREFLCEVLLSRIEINGEPYIQASVRDISERVRLQKVVEETRIRQLNAARLASLGEMAGGIAHEINNPIAVIRGQAELLQRSLAKYNDPNLLQDGITKIIRTVDRITKIIKGLRAVSRDSSEDPMSDFNLLEIIDDTLNLFDEKLKIAGIRFDLECNEKEINIFCRPSEISQVILNLMNNSYDAVREADNPWIRVTIHQEMDKVILKFIDSGPGISTDLVSKIFEPFYTTKEVGKGTGLGLSISRNIIERHKGDFFLDTNSPSTAFVIKLPRRQ